MAGERLDLIKNTKMAHYEVISYHKRFREGYKEKFENYRNAVKEYPEKFEASPSERGTELWEGYIREKGKMILVIEAALQDEGTDVTVKRAYQKDKEEFDEFEQKEKKEMETAISSEEKIRNSNERISGLIEEIDGDIQTGQNLNKTYKEAADKYVEEGKEYPDPIWLDTAEESGNKSKKNIDLVWHKITSGKSKSSSYSKDILNAKNFNATVKRAAADQIIKDVKKYREKEEEMKQYKEGNDKFDAVIKNTSTAVNNANADYEKFMPNDNVRDEDNNILNRNKQAQYDKMRREYDKSKKDDEEINKFFKNVVNGKVKISQNRYITFGELKGRQNELKSKMEGAEERKNRLLQYKADLSKPENEGRLDMAWNAVYNRLEGEFNIYDRSSSWLKMEEDADNGQGIIPEIENDYADYQELITLVLTRLDESRAKNANNLIERYEAYKETRGGRKDSYQKIKPYLGSKPERMMIMKLVRRVKLLEAAGDKPLSSEYDGKASKILKFFDKVESKPGELAERGLKKAGMTDETNMELVKDAAGGLASEAPDSAGFGLDVKGDIEDWSEGTNLNNTGKMWKQGEDNGSTPKSQMYFETGMNIMGTIQGSFAVFKEVLVLMKEWSGGADAREKGKRLLSLANEGVELFDSVSGFFDIPGLSVVKSAFTILLRIIDIIRSGKSRGALNERRKELKQKMQNDETYGFGSKKICHAAKGSGFDSRGWGVVTQHFKETPSSAAKAYAIKKREEGKYREKFQSTYVQSAENQEDKEKRKEEEENSKEDAGRNRVTGNMFTRMHQLKAKRNELSETDQEELKSLEIISNTNEYLIMNEARVRMKNKQKDDIYDIVTEGWSIASSFMKFTASPAAIAAIVGDIAFKVGDIIKNVGSRVNSYVRDRTGNFYSSQNKQNRRNQMGESMYDRLALISTKVGDNGELDTSNMEDWEYTEIANHLETIDFELSTGLDAYISHIIEANSKDEMIEQMSSAFSVEGN